jgi:hypothetical protein
LTILKVTISQSDTVGCRVLARDDEESNSQSAAVKLEQSIGQNSSGFTKDDLVTDKQFANEGLAYARDVEITNGRWAMLG